MAHISLVPTPIGNLEDITLRALRCLREVEVIAAEDTRHSGKLLSHYQIDTPLVRLDAHTMAARAPEVLARYTRIAYISDAGMPGISDPGSELVRLARQRGDSIDVLPGASALLPALVISGLPLGRFHFEGFLPRKGQARRERLEALVHSPVTSAFYEAPQRLCRTLAELQALCSPERQVSVSREISKLHESHYQGSLAEVQAQLCASKPRGELVVVLEPFTLPPCNDQDDWQRQAQDFAAQGLQGKTLRQALIALGAPRNLAYSLALSQEDAPEPD